MGGIGGRWPGWGYDGIGVTLAGEGQLMKRLATIAAGIMLLAGVAVAGDGAATSGGQETVPKTVEGGSQKFKAGGKEMGEGFRAIGRGIKDVFTGKESKKDFKGAAKIGDGGRDVGLGTAGIGRGVGRGIKKGFKGDGSDGKDEESSGK